MDLVVHDLTYGIPAGILHYSYSRYSQAASELTAAAFSRPLALSRVGRLSTAAAWVCSSIKGREKRAKLPKQLG